MIDRAEGEFVITWLHGLHARPAAALVKLAASFASDVFIARDDLEVNAKSIMGVMVLAAVRDTVLRVRAVGVDARQAVDAIGLFIRADFGMKVVAGPNGPETHPTYEEIRVDALRERGILLDPLALAKKHSDRASRRSSRAVAGEVRSRPRKSGVPADSPHTDGVQGQPVASHIQSQSPDDGSLGIGRCPRCNTAALFSAAARYDALPYEQRRSASSQPPVEEELAIIRHFWGPTLGWAVLALAFYRPMLLAGPVVGVLWSYVAHTLAGRRNAEAMRRWRASVECERCGALYVSPQDPAEARREVVAAVTTPFKFVAFLGIWAVALAVYFLAVGAVAWVLDHVVLPLLPNAAQLVLLGALYLAVNLGALVVSKKVWEQWGR